MLVSIWLSVTALLFSSDTLKVSTSCGGISILSSLFSMVTWSILSIPKAGDPSKTSSTGPLATSLVSATRILSSKSVSSCGTPSFAMPSNVSGEIIWLSCSSEVLSIVVVSSSLGCPESFNSISSGGIKSGLASDCILLIVSWFNAWANLIFSGWSISGLTLKKTSFS